MLTRTAPPRLAIARHVERRARLWALIWGLVFGLEVLAQARGYVALYPTAASRLKLGSSLQSYVVLVGPAHHAETIAGFTVWKVLVFCAVIAGIWGVRASVGLLRGQEDTGQWELLLSGPTSNRQATGQALLGFGAASLEMFVVTALCTLLAGTLPGVHFPTANSLLFAMNLVVTGTLFLAVGALTSQLWGSRAEATTAGMLVLGGSYLLSMVANSRTGLGWLRWLTPIGWVEELRPFRDTQPLALALPLASAAMCGWIALLLAGRRDVLRGVLPERAGPARGSRLLRGPTSLAVKLIRNSAMAWLAGLGLFAGVFGMLTRSAAAIYASTPQLATVLSRLGAHRVSQAFLGTMFLMYAVALAVLAASLMAAIREEEASGRLDNLLVQPLPRLTWLASRLGPALALVVAVGLAAAVATWLGAASQHARIDLGTCLEAGVNTLAPAIFVLGAGTLVLGLRPRWTAAISYGIVGYSFLMELLGSFIRGNEWIKGSSLFSHMALAPAAAPDWSQAFIVIAIGGAAAALGVMAFQRRDLKYA
jgi:ABC-2 type transport system permease protein